MRITLVLSVFLGIILGAQFNAEAGDLLTFVAASRGPVHKKSPQIAECVTYLKLEEPKAYIVVGKCYLTGQVAIVDYEGVTTLEKEASGNSQFILTYTTFSRGGPDEVVLGECRNKQNYVLSSDLKIVTRKVHAECWRPTTYITPNAPFDYEKSLPGTIYFRQ